MTTERPSSSAPPPSLTKPPTSTASPGSNLAELRARAAPMPRDPGDALLDLVDSLFPLIVAGSAPVGLFILWLRSDPMPAGETNWWPIGMLGLLALWFLASVIRGSR